MASVAGICAAWFAGQLICAMPMKPKKSIVAALIAFSFLCGQFCLTLASPGYYYYITYAGILIGAALAVYYWRKERTENTKAFPVGLWVVFGIFVLWALLCFVLPMF